MEGVACMAGVVAVVLPPGEQVLVQVWDGDGNGDREMSNISETLDKCPRTKDTCQLSAC